MTKMDLPKSVVASVIAAVVIVGFIVYNSLDSTSDKKKTKNENVSVFDIPATTRTQQTLPQRTSLTTVPPAPFTKNDEHSLNKLAVTGDIDPSQPDTYVSPRWEAILGGDQSSGIPLSELNKASNSDLDQTTFEVSRQAAIDLTYAIITGEGASNWPAYFQGTEPGQCTEFKVDVAGAISMPYPGDDDRWILAYVFWEAKCSNSSELTRQMSQVYFSADNFQLVPRRYSEIPHS